MTKYDLRAHGQWIAEFDTEEAAQAAADAHNARVLAHATPATIARLGSTKPFTVEAEKPVKLYCRGALVEKHATVADAEAHRDRALASTGHPTRPKPFRATAEHWHIVPMQASKV